MNPNDPTSSTDSPGILARVRRMAATTFDRGVAECFQKMGDWYLDEDEVARLKRNPAATIAELRRILASDEKPAKKTDAAVLLYHEFDLGEEALDDLFRLLSHPDSKFRAAVLDRLKLEEFPEWKTSPKWHELLLRQLDDADEDVVWDAMWICGDNNIPGVNEKFVELFPTVNIRRQSSVIRWMLDNDAPQEIVAPLAMSHITSWTWAPDDDRCATIAACMESTVQTLRDAARDRFRRIVSNPATTIPRRDNGVWRDPVEAFIKCCDESDADLLRKLAAFEGYCPTRERALNKLFEMVGSGSRDELIVSLAGESFRTAADAIARQFAGTQDREIIERLSAVGRKTPCKEVALALFAVGGETVEQTAIEIAERCNPVPRMTAMWKIYGWTIESVKDQVVATGIISSDAYDEAVEKIKTNDYVGIPKGETTLDNVLYIGGLGAGFCGEYDFIPCPHDRLLIDFASKTNGKLTPEAVSQQVHLNWKRTEVVGYTLRFIANQRVYQTRFESFGDWYNASPVIDLIHRALADAGHQDRFALIDDRGEPSFLFAPPRVLDQLERDLYLPMARQPLHELLLEQSIDKDRRFNFSSPESSRDPSRCRPAELRLEQSITPGLVRMRHRPVHWADYIVPCIILLIWNWIFGIPLIQNNEWNSYHIQLFCAQLVFVFVHLHKSAFQAVLDIIDDPWHGNNPTLQIKRQFQWRLQQDCLVRRQNGRYIGRFRKYILGSWRIYNSKSRLCVKATKSAGQWMFYRRLGFFFQREPIGHFTRRDDGSGSLELRESLGDNDLHALVFSLAMLLHAERFVGRPIDQTPLYIDREFNRRTIYFEFAGIADS